MARSTRYGDGQSPTCAIVSHKQRTQRVLHIPRRGLRERAAITRLVVRWGPAADRQQRGPAPKAKNPLAAKVAALERDVAPGTMPPGSCGLHLEGEAHRRTDIPSRAHETVCPPRVRSAVLGGPRGAASVDQHREGQLAEKYSRSLRPVKRI